MESIIKQDLTQSFQTFFTKKGMENVLSKHFCWVNYSVYAVENSVSLFDFLAKKQKQEDKGDRFFGKTDSLSLEIVRLRSVMRKILLAFNLERKSVFGKEVSFSYVYPWEWDFAYDIAGHAHSREAILRDLRLDPESFQNGEIPHNLPDVLDRLVNKGKHYFLFFAQNFRKLHVHDKVTSENIAYFFLPMAHFLLNDEDPDWKEGFKTRQERMKIASDFLSNCINNSGRIIFGGKGEQNLEGAQVIPDGICITSFKDRCDSSQCMMKHVDFPKSDTELIDQFKFSLIPAHKKADKLFGFMLFQKEFFQGLCYRGAIFRFFWQNDGFNGSRSDFNQKFTLFIQKHPEYAMEDYHEKKEDCMKEMGIDNAHDFFRKIAGHLFDFVSEISNDVVYALWQDYGVFVTKVHDQFKQYEQQEEAREGLHSNKAIDKEREIQ